MNRRKINLYLNNKIYSLPTCAKQTFEMTDAFYKRLQTIAIFKKTIYRNG
jgi:hypothetical protein